MYGPETRAPRGAGTRVMMFGYYLYNNIGIAFRTFASRIFVGVGSVFILVYNGLVLGAVGGHVHNVAELSTGAQRPRARGWCPAPPRCR